MPDGALGRARLLHEQKVVCGQKPAEAERRATTDDTATDDTVLLSAVDGTTARRTERLAPVTSPWLDDTTADGRDAQKKSARLEPMTAAAISAAGLSKTNSSNDGYFRLTSISPTKRPSSPAALSVYSSASGFATTSPGPPSAASDARPVYSTCGEGKGGERVPRSHGGGGADVP